MSKDIKKEPKYNNNFYISSSVYFKICRGQKKLKGKFHVINSEGVALDIFCVWKEVWKKRFNNLSYFTNIPVGHPSKNMNK
jgi:hypothetical protein